ncbi:MAG: hypothetical protein IPN84_09515 [Sphingomonadales bacterium]|nr:hypothetical protein [Sphingomonadales bacterium]
MADVLERVPASWNGRRLRPEAIACREAQHHPNWMLMQLAQAAEKRWSCARCCVDEAERLAIDGASLTDAEGRPLAAGRGSAD